MDREDPEAVDTTKSGGGCGSNDEFQPDSTGRGGDQPHPAHGNEFTIQLYNQVSGLRRFTPDAYAGACLR
jgi:hypothetical protein